ncbi:type II toxin-antitoxin system prevent-host-death family antitoxin [Azospirillum sp. SYSU D00513]|uniref:type II toxin-antitoxin system prevent-host-death family antitoxin n=1 Tax=Azospirillum sp. SYSU D00513 TaxID=2812561 RepID=UPI001A964E0F
MRTVELAEAGACLGELVALAASGEPVCITVEGKPAARLVAAQPPRRPVDVAALRALTDSMPVQGESDARFRRAILKVSAHARPRG